MPIYEYACVACGATLEAFQGINDIPLTDCQQCFKPTLQKLMSTTGFRLKGDGWYATGYEIDLKKGSDIKKNLVDSNAPSTSTVPAASSPSNASKTETSV